MGDNLEELERKYEESLRRRLPQRRSERFGSVPLAALSWMALAPFWPLNFAVRGFPIGADGELGTGSAVEQTLGRMRDARLVNLYEDGSVALGPSYRMNRAQRADAINYILETLGGAALEAMRRELRRAGETLATADEGAQLLCLSPPLQRWLSLALRADNLHKMAALLDSQVADEIAAARSRNQLDSPAARYWIDTAEPHAELFGGVLKLSVQRARRRLELLRRDGVDIRHLDNYLAREEQDRVFREFIEDDKGDRDEEDESDNLWALHYVGEGGAGKTMLVRHIMFELAPKLPEPPLIARVDFDSLNPYYPSRAPGLLLMALAEELRLRGNIPDHVFQRFDDKVRSVHARLEGAYHSGASSASAGVEEQEFNSMIAAFVGALKGIKARPLFILDTCEELAKLDPEGTPSDNVEATFRALEAIHHAEPRLRVIFAGRRALASAGAGWTTPSPLPARPFLRLHEIRGFDEQEARAFLSEYKKDDRQAPEELFKPIIDQSLLTEAGAPLRFSTDGGRASDPVARYNPYELDLYAVWACSEEQLDPQTLISGGLSYYVRERIVARVSEPLRPLLPAFVRLRLFDRESFDRLLDALRPLAGDAAGSGERRQPLFDDLISQEWLGLSAGGEEWLIDQSMWRRLSEFYAAEERAAWSAAARPAAELLRQITLTRSLSELSTFHFEAALRAQAELPDEEAAHWWEQVEARLAAEGAWQWASRLTSFLLSDEGAVAASSSSEPESALRPAVLATNSAAKINLSENDSRLLNNWQEVSSKAHLHPTERGAARLKFRATAGLCAHIQWRREAHTPAVLDQFIQLLEELPSPAPEPDAQTAAAEFALLESLLETVEHLDAEWGAIGDPVFCGKLNALYLKHFSAPGEALGELWPEMRAYATILRARLEKACLQHTAAVTSFHEALDQLMGAQDASGKRCWLGWRRPDDLRARVKLEFIRGIYPTYLGPDYVLACVPAPLSCDTIDSDRLRAALFRIEGYLRPLSGDAQVSEAEESFRTRVVPPACNAHREFAPHFVSLLAARSDAGMFDHALSEGARLSKQAEAESNIHLGEHVERIMAGLALRARVYDEKGLYVADALSGSERVDDIALRCALGALRGQPERLDLEAAGEGSAKRALALRHIAWRSSCLEPDEVDRRLVVSGGEFSHTSAAHELAAWLDGVEAASLDAGRAGGDWRKTLGRLELSGRRWARAHLTEPLEAVRQYMRIRALTAAWLGNDESLAKPSARGGREEAEVIEKVYSLLREQVGGRRCAEIAFEEGTLLSLRLPDSAAYLFRKAHGWYSECGDDVNCLLSSLSQALVVACSADSSLLGLTVALAATDADYTRCLRNDRPVPRVEEYLREVATNRNDITGAVNELSRELEEQRAWRPWFIRWCVCLAREEGFAKPGPKMKVMLRWLWMNYSFSLLNSARLSPELERLFLYGGDKPSEVKRTPDGEEVTSGWSRFMRTLRVAAYGLFISSLVAVGYIFINLLLLLLSEPLLYLAGFTVTTFKALLLQVGLPVFIAACSYTLVALHSARITVGQEKEIADASRPLLTPARLRLNYYVRALKLHYAFGKEALTEPAGEENYDELAQILPEKFAWRLRRLGRWSRWLRLNMDVCVVVDEKNTAAPWEAIFDLAANPGAGPSRLQFRRETKVYSTARLKPLPLPLAALSLVDEPAYAEMAARGWAARVKTGKGPKQLPARDAATPVLSHKVESGLDADEEEQRADVGILHLVGVMRETSRKPRLEIRAASGGDPGPAAQEGGSPAAGAEGAGTAPGTLLWAEDVVRRFPQLRVCLLQTPPHGDEPRTSGDRYAAGLLRRFGADLFSAGVPAVIILPPLDAELSEKAIQLLARHVEEVMRKPRSRGGAHSLLSAARELRNLINREGHKDREASAELAFDVCLYLDERFDLLIDPKSR